MICPVSKKCSGCQLSNLTYEEQLKLKQSTVNKLLSKYCKVEKIIGMDEPYHYRNKAQAVIFTKNGENQAGVYQSAEKRVVAVESCFLNPEEADAIINTVKKLCGGFKIKPYDIKTKKGTLRHVLVRKAFGTGEIMCTLVTNGTPIKSTKSFVNELVRRHPEITTVTLGTNKTDMGLMLDDYCEVLYGNGYIKDELCGKTFKISPRSFYQVNYKQTEKLYTIAREFADIKENETVIDAYCGTGTIGLIVGENAKKLIGVEINSDAIKDARENAKINGAKNARFFCADAGKLMTELAANGENADVVITDPPRAGCSFRFIKSLAELSPSRVVYISCNPETLERDLGIFYKFGYKTAKLQPIDMFPFTKHCEAVCLLTK